MSKLQSLDNALEILNLFRSYSELSISQIARQLNMHKSTVARVLYTLEPRRIAIRSVETSKWRLGPNILKLTDAYLSNVDLVTIGLPYLEELRARTGETSSLYVVEGDERVCIARLESQYEVRPVMQVGRCAPLHAGAPGKVLLAFMNDERIKQLINKVGMTRYTDHTITNEDELRGMSLECRRALPGEIRAIGKSAVLPLPLQPWA